MVMQEGEGGPPQKRRKLRTDMSEEAASTGALAFESAAKGLDRPISPPLTRRRDPEMPDTFTPTWSFSEIPRQTSTPQLPLIPPNAAEQSVSERDGSKDMRFIPSPVQLTRIKELGPHQNVDTVSLKDILGDPMIKECWNFNFLFDLDFVMSQFDSDVRDIVKVKIVHGFWKKDDERRISLLGTAEKYPNIELLSAYIPDPFGTHHSKMLILLRHDDLAQVVIHTANMIPRDWGNMTQAVWTSPLLPLLSQELTSSSTAREIESTIHPIGSGERFKTDLLRYIGAYERRLTPLAKQLIPFDFSSIRAAFIGSAPSRQNVSRKCASTYTSFGWLGLREILSTIPVCVQENPAKPPHIIIQISSIATSTAAWHSHFQSVLAHQSVKRLINGANTPRSFQKASTLFARQDQAASQHTGHSQAPKFNVIFPTPAEIRRSLDGYGSGASIHVKLQSAQQQKQLEYLHPLLCHWQSSLVRSTNNSRGAQTEAHRGVAAPHIKTYIRFSNEDYKTIDWAMVTSANLSTQAWGAVVNKKDEAWIQSWETGIVVWPSLFADTKNPSAVAENVSMVPVFAKDIPGSEDVQHEEILEGDVKNKQGTIDLKTVVGFRMPYDLPLSPYAADDKPWCASSSYSELDWKGQAWRSY
ncbi:tyrosyl-DNA phosphodiesterase I [Pyrenochaeta sp. MPI-SDFR-AT-0127]|nr:tyrosyl-DNA phosphodiesterase I [Pyrenochaeta sp. MPI-SDFR-AT-0127]